MKQLEKKSPINTRTMIMAVAMTALLINGAWAASPKMESVVTGDVITLGDIFDGVTENAGYILAPAPEPGKTKTLNANDLMRVSQAFNLDWKAQSPLDQIVIRREAVEIDRYAIEAALQEKLANALPGTKFEMHLADKNLRIYLPPQYAATVEADDVTFDRARNEFRAVISAPSSSDPLVKKEIRGRLYALAEVPVLKSALRSGDIISASDIEYVDAPAKDITTATIMSAEKLIGMTPRRGVAAGKAVIASDLELPMVVKKGEAVTMTFKNSTMTLTAQGKALESGAAGESVRIVNTASNQVVEGIVTGPQAIDVTPVSVKVASN